MASSQAPGIVKRGILIKQGHMVKNWKRRLFVLDAEAKTLQYYTCVGGEQLKGTFLLSGGWVQHVDEASAGKPNCIEVVGNARRLLLSAESYAIAESWARSINEVLREAQNSSVVPRDERTASGSLMSKARSMSVGPVAEYLAKKCVGILDIEGLGFYTAYYSSQATSSTSGAGSVSTSSSDARDHTSAMQTENTAEATDIGDTPTAANTADANCCTEPVDEGAGGGTSDGDVVTVYVLRIHTADSFWHIYKRFSSFGELQTALRRTKRSRNSIISLGRSADRQSQAGADGGSGNASDFGSVAQASASLPPLPSRRPCRTDAARTARFKGLFEWLQALMVQLRTTATRLLQGTAADEPTSVESGTVAVEAFLRFLVDGANRPCRPAPVGAPLPAWATPPQRGRGDGDSASTRRGANQSELSLLASRLGVCYNENSNSELAESLEQTAVSPAEAEPSGALADLDRHASAMKDMRQAATVMQNSWRSTVARQRYSVRQAAETSRRVDEAKQARIDSFIATLQGGINVIKHGRRGKPHKRRLTVDASLSMLSWGSAGGREVPLALITQIREGADTAVFARAARERRPIADDCCFSFIMDTRTVDIEATSREERVNLVTGFQELLQYVQRAPSVSEEKAVGTDSSEDEGEGEDDDGGKGDDAESRMRGEEETADVERS